jgi:acyl-CoA thioesterase FadM
MGCEVEMAQVRTIPIYVVATVTYLAAANPTDRLKHRYTFTMIGVAIATVGYAILVCEQRVAVGVCHFALFSSCREDTLPNRS